MIEVKKHELNHRTGIYRGVKFEIKNWKTINSFENDKIVQHWAYYLILFLSRIPEENNPKSYWLKDKKHGFLVESIMGIK